MNILINGVGGPTPRGIARSIKRHGDFKNAKLIGTDINSYAYGLYENDLYDKTYVIPGAGKEGYWEAIEDIIKTHKIDVALVHPELEVLEWTKKVKEGYDLPCKTYLPDFSVADLLVDKAKMTDVLADTGLVPKSVNIDPSSLDFTKIEAVLEYPFWIRATAGSSGLGSLKVESRDSLKNWITINPGVKQFIGSEYLAGRNLACKLLYHKGKLVRSASGERVNYIMAKVAPSGITGNTSFGRLLNEPELVDAASKTMDKVFEVTGAEKHGFFTADFKEDANGKPYITEVNVRMVAFNLAFAAAGAHFTNDILQLITDEQSFNREYKMYKFDEGQIFLRDVDAEPKFMNEKDLLLQ